MTEFLLFPSLQGWEATRDTLHLYLKAIGVVPRTHALFHPKWWHISLKVVPDGLITKEMYLPDGSHFIIKLNLENHSVGIIRNQKEVSIVSMTSGLSATKFGDVLFANLADLGIDGKYERHRFDNEEKRTYKPSDAEKYLSALNSADRIFKLHQARITGDKGPVQLWPHNFDLAFEWFCTCRIEYFEGEKVVHVPAQLNLGFSAGDQSHPTPYFYSNPWPFEAEQLLDKPLPAGARWFTDSWKGTLLPYTELVGDPLAEERLLDFASIVYNISVPILLGKANY